MKRILGIDWGERWLGFAVSDPMQVLASPSRRADAPSPEEALAAAMREIEEHDVEAVVVGVPFNMDGSLGPMGAAAKDFAESLSRRSGLPVHLWDERLTTLQAEQYLRKSGFSRKKRRERRDILSARIILQSFLESREGGGAFPEEQGEPPAGGQEQA